MIKDRITNRIYLYARVLLASPICVGGGNNERTDNDIQVDFDGEPCAEAVEKEIGAFVRGSRVDEEKNTFEKCLICGKPAGCTVYIAKSY